MSYQVDAVPWLDWHVAKRGAADDEQEEQREHLHGVEEAVGVVRLPQQLHARRQELQRDGFRGRRSPVRGVLHVDSPQQSITHPDVASIHWSRVRMAERAERSSCSRSLAVSSSCCSVRRRRTSSSTLAHASSSASGDLASSPHAVSGLAKSRLLEPVRAPTQGPRDRL